MKFLSQKNSALIAAFVLIAVVGMSSGIPFAFAQSTTSTQLAGTSTTAPQVPGVPNNFSCGITSLATCFVLYVAYSLSNLVGLIISFVAWFIQIGLQLRLNVFNSPAVQAGFAACLSLANLGFVLVLIIMALATILHQESYGYKKTFWRVIIMAILINFALVITAPIVGFANDMTTYFINSVNGGSAGVVTFVNTLAQQSSPAVVQAPSNCGSTTSANSGTQNSGVLSQQALSQLCQNQSTTKSPATTFTQALLSVAFSIIFQLIIVIAFASIAVLIFMSYIWLTILLILAPFAWIAWIFPKYSNKFSEWWSNFFKWTFTPAFAMFFIWLAGTIQNSSTYFSTVGQTATGGAPATQTAVAAIATAIGSSAALNQFITNGVVLSIMIGGLAAASSTTKSAADFVVNQGKVAGKAITSYTGKRAKKAATAPFRGEGARNLATRLQRKPLFEGGNPLSKTVAVLGGNKIARKIGQGMETAAIGGGKVVDDAAAQYKGLTKDQRLNRLGDTKFKSKPEETIALLGQISEDKNINKLSLDEMKKYFGEDQKDKFTRLGQEKLFKELREKSGLALLDIDKEIKGLEGKTDTESIEKLEEKQAEKKKLLTTYVEENTDQAVEMFANSEKLKKKKEKAIAKMGYAPANLENEMVERVQEDMVKGIANGNLSQTNISTLIKALAKKNDLDGFQSAVEKFGHDPATKNELLANDKILKWNDKQVGRGTLEVDLREAFDINTP